MENRPTLRPLTLPFAVLGLVGGALLALRMGPRPFDLRGGELIIPLTTALVAARLGHLLSKPSFEPPLYHRWWLRVVGRALTSGGLNGLVMLSVFIGSVMFWGWKTHGHMGEVIFPGTLMAWLFGACMSVPFMPSLLVVAGAHQRALVARPGSLASQNLRGRVWLATFILAAAHLGLGLYWANHDRPDLGCQYHQHLENLRLAEMNNFLYPLLAMALVGGATVLASQFEGWRRLRYARSLTFQLDRYDPSAATPLPQPHADVVDLGVGEGAFVSVATSGADPYRATELRQVRVTGDPMATLLVLRRATRWLLWSLALVGAVAWCASYLLRLAW